MKKFLLFASFILAYSNIILGQNPYPLYNHWIPDNWVQAIASDGVNTYIGGSFSTVGPPTGAGTKITATNTNPDLSQCRPNSIVTTSIPDGFGGWYIGGNFNSIVTDSATTVTRNYLAHILPNGKLDLMWNPNPNSNVYAIAVDGASVYVGGWFTTIGGQLRNRIAKLNAAGNGNADATWNPNVTGGPDVVVEDLLVSGNELFVAGNFTNIGAQPRNHIAKLSTLGTGLADAMWNPNADCCGIETMLLSGAYIYVGGSFSNIGGQARNRLAKLSTTGTGTADAVWDPNVNGNWVASLAISGNTLYVGGYFTNIGGLNRNNIARISTTGAGNAIILWNPNADNAVRTISLSGNDLYIGGIFKNVGGQYRQAIAKLSATGSGTADATWNPNPNRNADVFTISTNGSDVYVGGNFMMMGGVNRFGLAKFSATGTCDLDTAWHPTSALNTNIFALLLNGNYLYAGGNFSLPPNSKLAKISTSGVGLPDPAFNGYSNNFVRTMALYGNSLYVGGEFTVIGSSSRNRIAKLNASTGATDPLWNPNVNGIVRSIAVNAQGVFAGGDFTTAGVTPRNRIAKFAIAGNGTADATWNANANAVVRSIALNGNDVYVGGDFSTIAAQARRGLAKLNANGGGGADLNWNPSANQLLCKVYAMLAHNNNLYVGGDFDTLGGLPRSNLAKLYLGGTGDAVTNWNPNVFNNIYTIAPCGSEIYLGGSFHSFGGQTREFLAKISTTNNAPLPVTISSFTGKKESVGNVLFWVTSSEQNNDFFLLQQSIDALHFNTIAAIESKAINGNSQNYLDYSFEDKKPQIGHNYYRLLQQDLDGNVKVASDVIDLNRNSYGPLIHLYPNPAFETIHLEITSLTNTNALVKITDLSGKLIQELQVPVVMGTNHFQLEIKNIKSGLYVIHIYDENTNQMQLLHSEKLVIR